MSVTATAPETKEPAVGLKELQELAQKNADGLAVVTKNLDGLIDKMSKTPADGQPHPYQVFGTPWARRGEDPMSSRGFSFLKMLGLITGACPRDQAKIEIDEVHNRLHKQLVENLGTAGYAYGGVGHAGSNCFLAPLGAGMFMDSMIDRKTRNEFKAMILAGTDGADIEQCSWIRRKMLAEQGYGAKTLSWLNELVGGALVAPPEFGELIELLRNKEALVNAGARTVPLPPQGRMKYPRQTSASTTYWVGENSPIPDSNIGTGEVTLQAKKLAVLIKAPNELIRFASPAAEALLRDDMTKSLALGLDLAGLEGLGGDNRPRGIIQMPNINRINSSSQTVDGDRFIGQDIYRMIAAVEESNAEFEGYIMRPKSLYKYYQLRFDAVAQGDAAGGFLFNLIREAGAGTPAMLGGYPVTKSTQVSQVRSKGASSNLTYILAGMFSDVLIGMFGAIEFAATAQGDTSFTQDQTWVRGILSADIQVRHEAAFVLMDNLSTTLA